VCALAACFGLASVGLAACGGSGSDPAAVIARVGPYAITKGMLSEWMTERIGEDFYTFNLHQAPTGLVSEPADYPACVAAAKRYTQTSGGRSQGRPSDAQLTQTCRALYLAVKEQAMEYLVSTYWSFNFYAKYGIGVNDAIAQHAFDRIHAEQYPGDAFEHMLAAHRRTDAQELLLLKNNELAAKVRERLLSRGRHVVAAVELASEQAGEAATCSRGYVVKYCKGYGPTLEPVQASRHSPDALLAELLR